MAQISSHGLLNLFPTRTLPPGADFEGLPPSPPVPVLAGRRRDPEEVFGNAFARYALG